MRFQVPQFIEIEDKIFGPLSFRQFVYIIGGAGISYLIYRLLPLYLAIIFIAPVAGLALALAFYQFNNKPFVHTLEAAFIFLTKNKLYLWKKEAPKELKKSPTTSTGHVSPNDGSPYNPITVPRLSESRLKDMSWGLEVKQDLTDNNEK